MDDTTSEGGSCGTTTHALLTLPVVLSVLWTLFCLFYHTRLLALLLSWLTNRFLNDSHVTIGSVRVSLFAGRILFTNVRYTTLDYSVSIVDGYASLKWWKGAQKVYRDWKEVELFLQLNGIRFHWYNRTEAYKEVERKFQKQWHASPGDDVSGLSTETEASGHSWMGITPRITCNMKKVKIVLGNSQVLDHNLVIYMNKGLFTYSYQLASCVYDEYRYVMGCEGTEVEAYWEPNKGTSDRVVFGRSRDASLLYTVDMPGPTPNNRQSIEVKHPEFTMELNFGGSSEIHAGPAIHRYRTELQRFFFPNDCCDAEVTRFPSEGEKRIYNQFVITVTLQDGGHIVLPFATKKDDGMASLTFSVDPRSYLKIILPWITYNDGYTSVVEGLFRSPSLKTSLAYQPVGQAQYAKLRTDLHFPRIWNGLQTWDMHVTLDQLNCNILFPYIDFIGDLLDDWNTGPPSDLMTFVPVQWQVAVQLSCYEVFLYTNHYNWMDVSGMARNENCRLAVCGKTGTLNFEFPFTDFLPVEQKINFSAEGQNLALRRYVPPSCTTKESIFALSSINKHRWRWPSHLHTQEAGAYDSSRERFPLGWVQNTTYQDGWVDLACSQAISIQVKYSSFANCVERENGVRPNVLKVEVEVPDIVLRIFGVLVRDLLGLKGNYTGDFPNLTVFDSTDSQSSQPEEISPKATADFAPPLLTDNCYDSVEHFLEIYITFRLPNGTIEFPVHLPRDTDGQNLPLPSGHADLLQVEFAYQQYDTRVAINVEAVSILVPTQGCLDGKTILGQLTIPSVMFRGHGLNETLYKERVEYAWIMDLDVGRVEGALATEQVLVVVDWLQSTVAHVTSPGDEMVVAPGGVLEEPLVEPLVGIMKYRVFTVSVCPCDVTLMEGNHLLRLTVPGFGLAACNLQGDEATWGVTFLLHGIQSHIYVSPEYPLSNFSSSVPSIRVVEVGQLTVGRIRGQINTRNPDEYFPSRQLQFLLKADALQRRLYFLWPRTQLGDCITHSLYDSEMVCGCFGGCSFFDGTLEKNKYFVQLQQQNAPAQMPSAYQTFPRKGSLKRTPAFQGGEDEPDGLLRRANRGGSLYSHHMSRQGSRRLIHTGEDSLSHPDGVSSVHTMLTRLRVGNNEDVTDYSSLWTLNRSVYSLNSKIVDVKEDDKETPSSSSSAESFMSALSEFASDLDELATDPQPNEVTKDLPKCWTSTVTFCPYVITTQLSPQRSQPRRVTIMCPRYRSHVPSVLPKVTMQLAPDEVTHSPTAAKVSVSIKLIEKCSLRLHSSALDAVDCVMKTAQRWVQQQSPTVIVDVLLDKCLAHANNMIGQNTACKQQPQLQTTSTTHYPTLYFSASMSPQCHLAVQLVSNCSKTTQEVISSACLLTLFATNVSCNTLYKVYPSIQSTSPSLRGAVEEQSSVSSTINCPVIQLQIVTLNVSDIHTPSIGSNKLGFMLKLPSHTSRIGIDMRDMVETSVTTTSGTVVGTIKNTVTPNVLSPSTNKMSQIGGELPTNTSRVAVLLQIKEVWLQVATPLKNTAQDLLLVCRFADQWRSAVSKCITSASRLINVKTQQRKQVMAQLLASILQQDGEDVPDKAHLPLSKNSYKLRSSTVYQLCRMLPGVTMTTTDNLIPHNAGLVAMVMGLGCRFLKRSRHKSSSIKRHSTSVDSPSCVQFNQYGYSSLRQLQQSVVPLLWSCGLSVQGKPVNAIAEVELSLVLWSVQGQVFTDSVDRDPEVFCSNINVKCNVSKESTTSGTQSLLFDMEKSLKLTVDNPEQLESSQLKTCGTVGLNLLQVNTSVPLLRYVSMIPAIQKLWETNRTENDDVAIAIEGGIDKPDTPCYELDSFSHSLVQSLIAADKDTGTNHLSVPMSILVRSLPSSPQQVRQTPEPPTPSSLDGLLQAEEGRGSDHTRVSGNRLQVPSLPLSGSESVSAGDEVDYSTRTPSPVNIDHLLPVSNEGTQITTENSSKTATSIFLLFHFNEIVLASEVFPFKAALELQKLTGSVNCNFDRPSKKQLSGVLPSSGSMSGTLNKGSLKLYNIELGVELTSVSVQPISFLLAFKYHSHNMSVEYQTVLHCVQAQIDVKQSPIVIHRQFQDHFPQLQQLYQELFPASSHHHPTKVAAEQGSTLSITNLPSQLPEGSVQVVIKTVTATILPLPSLTVSYKIGAGVTVLLETASSLRFSVEIADSVLRFSPKVHKDELAGRIPLPPIYFGGTLLPSDGKWSHAGLDLELMIKEINVDLTTDVLNQLLVVQIAFIKELNELVQTLISVKDSIRTTPSNDDQVLPRSDNTSTDLLKSFQFTLHAITITVTTPSSTAAVRFSTTKTDVLIKKTSNNRQLRSIMALHGRVEVDLTLALGYLTQSPGDIDDFKELVLFETKITVKNSPSRSIAAVDSVDGLSPDAFHITIHLPHLHLQPAGIDKALIFWVHCESAYCHWLEERKAVADEVQRATSQLMDNISTVEPSNTSLNFQQPKLVQITVNDMAAYIPLVALPHLSISAQKAFPALVLGIKEMRISVNLSHRVVSKGHFSGFGLRFTESFSARQRAWAIPTKINNASVPRGSYSLCMDRKRPLGTPSQEKVICFFQFLMSGLEVHTNSMLGRYISLLTKAFVPHRGDEVHGGRSTAALERERPKARRILRKGHKSASTLTTVERDLSKQSRLVNKLRQQGEVDKLPAEIEHLQKLEAIAASQWRKTRRKEQPQNPFGNFTRLFSPFSKPIEPRTRHTRTGSLLVHSNTNDNLGQVQSAIDRVGDHASSTLAVQRGHRRAKSDIHDIATAMALSGGSDNSRPSSRPPSQLSAHEEMAEDDGESSPTPTSPSPSPTPSRSPTPILDFEISVAVEVESGKIYFYNQLYEDDNQSENSRKRSYHSPMLSQRRSNIHPSSSAVLLRKGTHHHVSKISDVMVLIPAVHFHTHYYSITDPTPAEQRTSKTRSVNFRLSPSPIPQNKKGILLFSVNIDSLPDEVKLQPSLLEFMEHVMKPFKGKVDSSGSTDSDSAESDSESGTATPLVPAQSAITIPVDVTIFLHIKPSMVMLSCQPYSKVECGIALPDVNLCFSFVLFSPQVAESSTSRLSSVSSSSSVFSTSTVRNFNNFCVSGAVQAFSFSIYNPSVTSAAQTTDCGGPSQNRKEVIGLDLGLASVHVSRQAVKVVVPNKNGYEKMKISVVVDIASIVLGFDMRRLNDVTAFRKCWYRKSVVESFMLGSHHKKSSSAGSTTKHKKPTVKPEPKPATDLQQQLTHAEIVCVANISDLSFNANVSTVMGNTSVILSQLTVDACADVKSSELVYLNLDCVLDSANVDARSGVIAGDLKLDNTKFDVVTSTEQGTIPKHVFAAQLELLKVRVDFMMTSVLAGTARDVAINIYDKWNNDLSHEDRSVQGKEAVNIVLRVSWDQAKLVISNSTTSSLENIVKRLKEFVLQQKRRSERTFLLMWPENVSTALSVDETDSKNKINNSGYEYNHWVWGTEESYLPLLQALGFTVTNNTHHICFMGTMSITGNSVCLACLHGRRFQETEWAIFSLRNVSASFSTQAIPSFISSARSRRSVGYGLNDRRICQQIVSASLGKDKNGVPLCGSVYRVENKGNMPILTSQPVDHWVSFVCVDHHIHPNSPQTKLFKYTKKLNISEIFGIPPLELNMTHDHFYPTKSHSVTECDVEQQVTARVVCAFHTTFHDSIAITTSAEHYFFLHNLVKDCLDYYTSHKKEDVATAPAVDTSVAPKIKVTREFSTDQWHLDPHLVLLAGNMWTSGSVNIGWLLEKLGFQEAKITIPQSVQCGIMDLLDEAVSEIICKLLSVSAKKKLS